MSTPLGHWSRPSGGGGGGGGVLRTSVPGPVGVGVCRIGEERRTVPFEFCDRVTDSGEGRGVGWGGRFVALLDLTNEAEP